MKFLPKNTLAYFTAAPQLQRMDLSHVPVSQFAAATKMYRQNCGLAHPNHDALTFYALNHCASIVKKQFTPSEPLPDWALKVMEAYLSQTSEQGKRLLHYILSIITREMRHIKSHVHMTAADWKLVTDAGGSEMTQFISSLSHYNEEAAVQRYMENPPEVTVGQYAKAMAAAFHRGDKGWGGGYGGTPWGQVADAAASMVSGVTSMEMMIDTGYTLAHNNGPIFNKGMMYNTYDGYFMTILDVQRSGQIPDLVLASNTYGVKKTPLATQMVNLVAAEMPKEFKGWVDYKLVDQVRPDKNSNPEKYTLQIKEQEKMKQVSPTIQKSMEKVLHGKKVVVKGSFDIYPGQSVTIFERVGA